MIKDENEAMKFEIAEELGFMPKINASGWKSLTARESGKIGGLMTKRRAMSERMKSGE